MATATSSLTRVLPALFVAALAAWPVATMGAASPDAQEGSPLLASLDSLARRPHVSWTAKRWLEGELVDKHERGWMEVVTRFDRDRGVSHTVLSEGGSSRIRQRALQSVLDREIGSGRQDEARRAAFSRDNYRYRIVDSPWDDVRIELEPLREDVRLLKGAAIVDSQSGDLLKVEGQLAQNPSFWIRDVHVARTYARFGDATLPVELVSTARVRMFGEARLRIRTQYLSVDGQPVTADAVASAPAARRTVS
jgi:hypothetical protein